MRWAVPVIGEFAYRTNLELFRASGDGWEVHWTPQVVHPELDKGRAEVGTGFE